VDPADVIELRVFVAARPETVFAFFTDPARYVLWMGTTATLDPRPGGVYRVWMREGLQATGEFVEVDPPRRLVFTWGWTGGHGVEPGSSRVEVSFEADDDGTWVLLRHSGLPDLEQVQMHSQGWDLYLDRLTTVASGGFAGPDPNTAP
jgi:uncharacterized protein YndB with AHSA1/START domain